jgi:excisionase family DNA binding protein
MGQGKVESLLIEILEAIRANGVPRRYLREDVAAVYLGQTPFFVGELIRSGRIRAIKPPGAKYRVLDTRDLDAFMAEQKAAEPALVAVGSVNLTPQNRRVHHTEIPHRRFQ